MIHTNTLSTRIPKLLRVVLVATSLFSALQGNAQIVQPKDSAHRITLKASESYYKSGLYRFFWGTHYRPEWHTPVTFPKVMLDTMAGGLVPYQTGGGRQSKSIRVQDKAKREYVFRSIDKAFGKALPEITQETFIEDIVNDQVTIAHPYAALVVAPLAEAAKIYHATPRAVYVPKQTALKEFNDSTGDILYTFEKRPDEDWATEPDFGNSKKIVSTEKMLEKILNDNDNSVDQRLFAKSRLFDILIGDWGRHEDQWRWASFKDDKKTFYRPIPRDRDNAFTKFDGALLKVLIPAAKAKHLQTFDYTIKDVNRLAFPARHLDHHLLNELSRQEWIAIANELKSNLTDAIIDAAVRQMPPEVYPISGPDITAKLKRRRDDLPGYAETYYEFLSTDVEVTGTEKQELFEVKRLSDTETEVSIYKITKEGEVKDKPLYKRVFYTNETNEIRLYGISGNDQYKVSGKVNKGIKVRLIGGREKDTYTDESSVKGPSHKTKIYDNDGNTISKTNETAVNLSKDTAINAYDYKYFNYNHKGIKPMVFYNNDDRVYVGLGYGTTKYKWRKYPNANTQSIDVKYSISQKALSSTYKSTFTDLLGKWNQNNYLNYDAIRWTNFYGLGNETVLSTTGRDYYRMRSEQFNGKIGVDRVFNNKHKIFLNGNYQNYRILNDTARFLAKQYALPSSMKFQSHDFAGGNLGYVFQTLDDSVLPVRGISFGLNAAYLNNLRSSGGDFGSFGGEMNIYIPFTKKFNAVIRGGATTMAGTPEFFQYNRLGGSETLRGYQRDRFYGNSTTFNQNELRWITDIRSHIFNGKFGLFGLYDAGRVWLKGESSNTWHTSYGGGIILSPFNKLTVTAAYAKSPEDANIHIHVYKPF
ncbi:MAG: hypothetical protein JWQ27_3302 [Ferruginibacter sp.]|nr:hypothetical protein [Ferruginibacter sp.]